MVKHKGQVLSGVPVKSPVKLSQEEIRAQNILVFTKRARQIIHSNFMPVQLEVTKFYSSSLAPRIFNDAVESSVVELARLFT